MFNSASKCLKITTLTGKVVKFSKPEKRISQKTHKLRGNIPP
jgi:hypothetical protein